MGTGDAVHDDFIDELTIVVKPDEPVLSAWTPMSLEAAMSDQEALGRDYLLGERIGQGDYAVLRRVTRRDGGPPVTATQLRPDLAGDPQVRALFGREEEKLRYLRHSSIVGVEDVVIEPGELVLITEPADRPDLRRLLADRGGRLAAEEAALIGGQIAAALAAGHAYGIRHLDLRPENVLVAPGRPVHVKVNNFGPAALLRDAGQDPHSIGGVTGYTAPEVRAGAAPTAAADVWSLGAILAELVTGAHPDFGAVARVPGELGAVVDDCLAPDPAERPDARSVADRLAAAGLPAPPPVFSTGVAAPPVAPVPDFPSAGVSTAGYPTVDFPPGPPPAPVPAAPAKRRGPWGPLVTLAAGVVLALVLGALSANAAIDEADRRDAAAVQAPPPANAPNPAAQQSTAAQPPPSPAAPAAAPPEKFQAAYAGRVKGGAASIAIAVRDGGAVAYLCDGRRLEAWLLGTASGGQLKLSGPDGASLTGSYDRDSAAGTVTAAGRTWSLDIRVAKKPSGLYRATAQVRGAQVVAGWIVLPGGDQVGMVDTGGVEQPAPELDLSSRSATVNGVPMTADQIDGTSENGF
jgi:serine/threonine protein kinase, bacterial